MRSLDDDIHMIDMRRPLRQTDDDVMRLQETPIISCIL